MILVSSLRCSSGRSCRQVSHDARGRSAIHRAAGNRRLVEKFALEWGRQKVTKNSFTHLKWLIFYPRGSAPHPAGATAPDPVFTVAAIPGAHFGSMTAQGGGWWKRGGGRAGARQGRTAQNSRRMFVFSPQHWSQGDKTSGMGMLANRGKLEVQRAPWVGGRGPNLP